MCEHEAVQARNETPSDQQRRPTIYDVARLAGVSKSLVSLVLQNSPRVSPERRAAVQQAIDELSYRPSRAAAALAGSRTRTIGVLLDDYRNLWFVDLLSGIELELAPLGYRVAVESITSNAHVDPSPLDGFESLRVSGIVVATEPTESMRVNRDTPVVVAGHRDLTLPGSDVVANDDRSGARLATEHLLGLGHTEIGLLSGGGGSARIRAEGFEAAIRGAGLSPLVLEGRDRGTGEIDGYQAAQQLLLDRPGTTAIFAANDTMALGAAAAARDAGRRIPEDLSLIGYDNSPLASSQLLRLTTIDPNSRQVGAVAAKSLLARMQDPDRESEESLVDPQLVTRSSTAPPAPRT
jgi:DNA-binding LacI/PurR family transcriptional regulator